MSDSEQWNVFETESIEGQPYRHGFYGGLFEALGEQAKSEKLGFNITTLDPGNLFCPYHLHHLEEELIFVIDGAITVRQNDEKKILNKGDLIFFKTGVAHQILNHTDKPAKLLAISNKDANDICEYPDSNKIYMRSQKKIYKMGTELQYMDGENQRPIFWK